jgi:hypothetical protein
MKAWLSLAALALVGCATGGGGAARGASTASHAERSSAPVKSWTAAETNGAGSLAMWSELSEPEGRTGVRVVADNADQTFNLLLSREIYGPDVHVLGLVRADSGEEDQGGGFVWRAKDESNYYVARWNPLEENLRVYHVVGGKRTKLASSQVTLDPSVWHALEVQMVGPAIRVEIDGHELTVADSTLADAGMVGLWTKADASTSFAEVEVQTIPRR